VSVPRLDAFVEEAFLARLAAETPIAVEGSSPDHGFTEALAALEAAEVELTVYRDANLITVIGRSAYVEGLTSRAGRVEEAREQVARYQRAQERGHGAELAETWPTLTLAEKRALLAEVLDSLVVNIAPRRGKGIPITDRVTLRWRDDPGQLDAVA
jgi:hypothetical protein